MTAGLGRREKYNCKCAQFHQNQAGLGKNNGEKSTCSLFHNWEPALFVKIATAHVHSSVNFEDILEFWA